MGTIAIIGLGEVGRIFAESARATGHVVRAYDRRFADPASGPSQGAAALGVEALASAAEAAEACDVVFCAVTAAQAEVAAAETAGGIRSGAFFVDLNSVSPMTKQRASVVVNGAGGRYVEAAVMTAVPPQGIKVPILLSGTHAAAFKAWADAYGMQTTVYSETLGAASSVKMCRSVIIKGLEAIVAESLLAARCYGVEGDVLASLADTLPGQDWPRLAHYLLSRSVTHGRRRAEEMAEVAVTVGDAGLNPIMAQAIASRQAWLGARLAGRKLPPNETLEELLDRLLAPESE